MSEKRDENGGRDEQGRFGVGNPGGGRKPIPPEVREILEAATPLAAQRLVQALDADKYVGMDGRAVPDWKARTLAAETLLSRLYGKPAQAITGEDGGPLQVGLDMGVVEMLRKLAKP